MSYTIHDLLSGWEDDLESFGYAEAELAKQALPNQISLARILAFKKNLGFAPNQMFQKIKKQSLLMARAS